MTSSNKPDRPVVFQPWDLNSSSASTVSTPPTTPHSPSGPAGAASGISWQGQTPINQTYTARARTPMMVLDTRPMLLRRDDSIWARAERARDEIYDAITRTCDAEQIDALIVKSGPFAVPARVTFECWVPVQSPLLTERACVTISVHSREFHRYDLEYSLEIADRGAIKRHEHLRHFDSDMAGRLIKHLLRRGEKPRYGGVKLRAFSWQLWRPKNKVDALGRDWAALGPLGTLIIGSLLFEYFPSAVGAIVFLAAIVWGIMLARRPVAVQSSGKPDAEPRTLTQLDSWQTVAPGLGGDAILLRDRVLNQLRANRAPNFRSSLEHIWYWGLDGKEEREQIVLGLGRALCFVHIYRYANDLYVGWDGHLNYGQWIEKRIARGWSRSSNRLTDIHTVEHGFQVITEYDVTDLNCLMEWTHNKLTDEVKQLLKERQIDAEIDFRIQRGERQGLTARRAQNGAVGSALNAVQKLQRKLTRTG